MVVLFQYCVWWNSTLVVLHWQMLSVGYGSNENRFRIGKGSSGWFFQSDCIFIEVTSCSHQFLSLSDEDSYHHLHQNLDVPFLCSSPVLHHQCVVLHYLALQHQCCVTTFNCVTKTLS